MQTALTRLCCAQGSIFRKYWIISHQVNLVTLNTPTTPPPLLPPGKKKQLNEKGNNEIKREDSGQ